MLFSRDMFFLTSRYCGILYIINYITLFIVEYHRRSW
uniref:Uncharacterized protein n=1 Tax=Arundo donax TaxID=35708 RepID=A0A0A9ALT5_ARUDO